MSDSVAPVAAASPEADTSFAVGKHYFVSRSERVDSFAHKRYTTPEVEKWRSIYLMGRLVEERGGEVKLHLTGNNFERDGGDYVFSKGQLLCMDGDFRTLEDHGKPDVASGQWLNT